MFIENCIIKKKSQSTVNFPKLESSYQFSLFPLMHISLEEIVAGDKSSPVEDNSSSSGAWLKKTCSFSFSIPTWFGFEKVSELFFIRDK